MCTRFLAELQETLQHDIPMCAHMGIQVHSADGCRVTMQAPLEGNRNHQATAFAGSLNALCTMAGWASVFLLTRQHGLPGNIVIRRSSIKYLKPVASPQILARCQPIGAPERSFFVEMLKDIGQAKIDVRVDIAVDQEVAVAFSGSYVVFGQQA